MRAEKLTAITMQPRWQASCAIDGTGMGLRINGVEEVWDGGVDEWIQVFRIGTCRGFPGLVFELVK